jgi:ABC-2 type transport system permease protein
MSHAQTAAQAELLTAGPRAHAAPPGRWGALRAGWTAMPDTLHAEWTKLRTVSGTAWLLAAVVTLTVAVSAAAAAATKCAPSPAGPPCVADTTKLSLTGIYPGQAVVAILAVLAVSNEYSTGMIRVTLAAMPRRLAVLAAKGAIVGALVLMAGTAAVAGSLLAGRLTLPGNGFTVAHGFLALSLAHGPTLRAACGSVLYLALIALFSLGIAAAVRDSAVAIGLSLGVLYVPPILIAVAVTNPVWLHRLERYTPMNAGLTIQATTGLRSLPITPWAGLGVLAVWAAGALLVGGFLLRLRNA